MIRFGVRFGVGFGEKQMIPDQEILKTLNDNPSFTGYGRAGEAMLTDGERVILSRTITKTLRDLEEDKGTDYQVAIWSKIQRELATCNWLARCGCWAVWKKMMREAKAKVAEEEKGITRADELKEKMERMFA